MSVHNGNHGDTAAQALQEGAVLDDRYKILNVIGIGGFGITYKGYDIYNEQLCAVKELFVNNYVSRETKGSRVFPHKDKTGAFEHAVERFMDEAETLKKLNGTPNVVKITDYFKQNNTAYFVMEYIDGRTLNGEMKIRGGVFEYKDALHIIKIIGNQLDNIHREHHIFHRDISPENIMLDNNMSPKLIDFGNAKNFVRDSDSELSVILKVGFAPPEQYTGKNQGPWTDVYSLACVFYYMVSGRKVPPSTERLIDDEYVSLSVLGDACSEDISDAIDRALILDPKMRTQSIKELVDVFDRELSKSGSDNNTEKKSGNPLNKLPYINVFEFGNKSGKWRIPIGSDVTIGRDGRYSNVVVGEYDSIVSKKHCIIAFDSTSGMFEITDVSKNGTYQKNGRLNKNRKYRIKSGERISFGNNKYIIETGVE